MELARLSVGSARGPGSASARASLAAGQARARAGVNLLASQPAQPHNPPKPSPCQPTPLAAPPPPHPTQIGSRAMAGLDAFLAEIGAAELSSVVSVPRAEDGLGPMAVLLGRVQQEIDAVNVSQT